MAGGDKHIAKGFGNQIKGEIKDQLGKATKNERLQASGKKDIGKGTSQKAFGDVKKGKRK